MFEYQRMPVGNPWQSTIGGNLKLLAGLAENVIKLKSNIEIDRYMYIYILIIIVIIINSK
jgi:hypothetical protein